MWEGKSGHSQTWTYAQFWTEVRRIAAGLHARGIVKGDRVLIHSDNCPEMVFSWYACATLGAIAVTTNTACVAEELAHAANVAGVKAAITQPRYAQLVSTSAGRLDWLAIMREDSIEDAAPHAPGGAQVGEPFDSLYGDPDDVPTRAREPGLRVGIVYTSGTTSRPKAVVYTHANLLWAGRVGPHLLDFGPDDVHFAQLPFFHVNAQTWTTAVALGVGGAVLLLPQPTVNRFWDIVTKYGVTHMSLMPLVERTLANAPIPAGQRMKVFQGGIPPRAFAARAGASAIAAYGMSETVVHTIHTDAVRAWPPNCLGRLTSGYEAKLVHPSTGATCAPTEDGELWIRGTRGVQLFLEYYNNPEANAKAFTADGWFKTGDIMQMDVDGIFFYRDRDTDRMKVGGENISASEVEAVIATVAGVAQVAVVARSDPRLDEVPVAFIVRAANAPDETVMRTAVLACCEARLSRFKRPRAVYFIDALPLGLLNKTSKVKLREMAEQRNQVNGHDKTF
jgi:crotonobetaine/carnitine-CoA ligase